MCDAFNSSVKGLTYFFNEVLFSAKHEGEWALDDIERGLGWALYCEKMAQEPHISCAIETYLESNPFKENYTIEDVKHLRKLLLSNLFINQLIPKDVCSLLAQISVKELGEDQTLEIITSSSNKVENYQTIITTLKKVGFEDSYNTFKVCLLMEAVSSGSIPHAALNSLLKSNGVIESLLKLSETLCEKDKKKMLNTLGEWIKLSLDKDNINYDLFYQMAFLLPHRISFLCKKFPGLQIKLLDIVNIVGKHLSIRTTEYKNELKYKCLIALCRTLLKSEQHLVVVTQTAFSSWFLSKEAHFWHKLYLEAEKEIK